jgi:hypothetical protein
MLPFAILALKSPSMDPVGLDGTRRSPSASTSPRSGSVATGMLFGLLLHYSSVRLRPSSSTIDSELDADWQDLHG